MIMEDFEEAKGPTLIGTASSEQPNISSDSYNTEILTREKLLAFLRNSTSLELKDFGDAREKEFATGGLLKRFPAYETVWREIISPATNRVFDGSRIEIRDNIFDDVLLLCQAHYSVMVGILRAHKHSSVQTSDEYFHFFCSLQAACEQVQLFLLLFSIVFERLFTWEGLVDEIRAAESGKAKIRSTYVDKTFIVQKQCWKDFNSESGTIARIRNALVHGPEIATYTDGTGKALMPRIGKHAKLLWTVLPGASNYDLRGYFEDPKKEATRVFDNLLEKTNPVWLSILEQSSRKFEENLEVRKAYGCSD